jgi:hypothetical protein
LGAINFITKKVTTVTNDGYITAVQVIELMKKPLEEYPGEAVKMVLDNAKYQRCKLVKMFAPLHGIELVGNVLDLLL